MSNRSCFNRAGTFLGGDSGFGRSPGNQWLFRKFSGCFLEQMLSTKFSTFAAWFSIGQGLSCLRAKNINGYDHFSKIFNSLLKNWINCWLWLGQRLKNWGCEGQVHSLRLWAAKSSTQYGKNVHRSVTSFKPLAVGLVSVLNAICMKLLLC